MAGDVNYYPHHIGDYLRDTVHLSALEDGTYRRMLDLYYASEKPLTADFDWLCKLVRARETQEREAVHEVLRQFFEKSEDGWRNKRADLEIRNASRRAKAARNNGKRGGRPITQRVISGLAKPNPTRNPSESSQNQNQNQNQNQKEIKTVASLPDWLPLEAWNTWLEVRTKVKAPNTTKALKLALGVLERLKAEGHDPSAVLENAALRGWKGLFAPPKNSSVDTDKLIREIEEEDKKRAAN
jgi:uncharacterized protein YdaU (DUF1376 family)